MVSLLSIVAATFVGWQLAFQDWRGLWLPIAILIYALIVAAYLRKRSRKESAAFFMARVDESTGAEVGFVVDSIAVVSALLGGLTSIVLISRLMP
jgi:hypothetical protein